MSDIVRIPNDHIVLACDARRAILLVNEGPVANPRLKVQDRLNADQETEEKRLKDQPGRRFDGGAAAMTRGPRSAMDVDDPEKRQAEAFAEAIAGDLARRHGKMPIPGLIIAAPPAFLGILRDKMSDDLRTVIVAEVSKDLTHMPVPALQDVLLASL